MFEGKRYITVGVQREIPEPLQLLMWQLIEGLPVHKDYLQVFTLSKKDRMQSLVHSQERPAWRMQYEWLDNSAVEGKVFVIDDGPYATMLLSDEY